MKPMSAVLAMAEPPHVVLDRAVPVAQVELQAPEGGALHHALHLELVVGGGAVS